MTDYNLNRFCNLLRDGFILDTYSAYGVMVDFKRLLKDIKSDVYTALASGNKDKELYLGYLINEIEKTDYPQDEEKVNVKKWLEKYQISLETIFKEDFFKTPFFKVFEIDTYLQDHPNHHPDDSEPYYSDAKALQNDFLFYFRWYFSKELLEFIHSLKENFKPKQSTRQLDPEFEKQYLDQFCIEIQAISSLHKNNFLQCYHYGILHFGDFLKEEVYKNLTHLSERKALHYLNYVHSKISNTIFFNTPDDYLEDYLFNYDIIDLAFPYSENKDLKYYLSTCYDGYHIEDDHREDMYDLQHSFFRYASMMEAKKMVKFIDEQLINLTQKDTGKMKNNPEQEKIKWIGKVSQLSTIIAELVEMDYIEPPRNKNGEINYTQFAKLIKAHFEVDGTEGTISKYLNIRSEKGIEAISKFKDEKFHIPHKSIMS